MISNGHFQDEHFKIRGNWWLPNSDQKVAGDLDYFEGDLTLTLYGGLNDARIESPFSATPETTEFPIILGESLDAVPLTVLNAFYTQWTPDIQTLAVRPGESTAIRSSRLHCGRLIEGMQLSSPDERFSKWRVDIPFLEEWLGETPFKSHFDHDLGTVRLECIRQQDYEFAVAAAQLAVRLVHSVQPPALPFGCSPAIKHRTRVELRSVEALPLDQLTKRSSEVVELFAMLFGGPVLSRQVKLHRDGIDDVSGLLFYPRHAAPKQKYDRLDFLIRHEHIQGQFGSIVEKWLSAPEPFRRARRMLASSDAKPSKFIELRFLPLVHAAELLSNGSRHGTIVAKSEYKGLCQRMLDSLPTGLASELIESITNSLGHANSRNLKRKLVAMLGQFEEATSDLFCVAKETFVKAIVDTRNHFTHYSTKQGHKILQGADLHWAIQKLMLMLRVFVLANTGVPEAVLQEAIRSHIRLSQERKCWQTMNEDGTPYNGVEIE